MKTILALAAVLLFSWPAAAQNNCNIDLKPLKPLTPLGCTDTAPVCLCNPSGTNCHWTWACVSSGRQSGIDPTIPLQVRPPQMPDLMETYRKAIEIRNLQLQTELLRQQTEALRRNNQIQEEDSLTATDSSVLDFPLADAYATMPHPTGNNKRDQGNWEKWRTKQTPSVQALLPPWSQQAYEKVRAMAAEQVSGVR
jgi:type II secretory pathway pseudopilin PulG